VEKTTKRLRDAAAQGIGSGESMLELEIGATHENNDVARSYGPTILALFAMDAVGFVLAVTAFFLNSSSRP
jgi:hypothetical protein